MRKEERKTRCPRIMRRFNKEKCSHLQTKTVILINQTKVKVSMLGIIGGREVEDEVDY